MSDHNIPTEIDLASRNGAEPAFSRPAMMLPNDNVDYGAFGLTKRELFAAMAMQGLLSNLSTLYRDGWRAHDIEEFACIRADALLAALEAPRG